MTPARAAAGTGSRPCWPSMRGPGPGAARRPRTIRRSPARVPPAGVIFDPNSVFGDLTFTINGSVFRYGHFLNTVLSFVLVCTVLYFVVSGWGGRLAHGPGARQPAA